MNALELERTYLCSRNNFCLRATSNPLSNVQQKWVIFMIKFHVFSIVLAVIICGFILVFNIRDSSSVLINATSIRGVGETLATRYFEVTVNSVKFNDYAGSNRFARSEAGRGNDFLILNVTYKNIDDEARLVHPGEIHVRRPDGKVLRYDENELVLEDGYLIRETLNPFTSITGNIAFRIPEGLQGRVFYQPGRSNSLIRVRNGLSDLSSQSTDTAPTPTDGFEVTSATPNGGTWLHNESKMGLYFLDDETNSEGHTDVEIRYIEPRAGLVEQGVEQGTLLFNGTTNNKGDYQGIARLFAKHCGDPMEYAVTGSAHGEHRLVFESQRPVRRNCQQTGETVFEELEFSITYR